MILVNDVTQFGDFKLLMGLSLVGCHICGLKLLFNVAQMCPFCEAKLFLTCLFQFMNLQQSFYRHQDGILGNSSQEQRISM